MPAVAGCFVITQRWLSRTPAQPSSNIQSTTASCTTAAYSPQASSNSLRQTPLGKSPGYKQLCTEGSKAPPPPAGRLPRCFTQHALLPRLPRSQARPNASTMSPSVWLPARSPGVGQAHPPVSGSAKPAAAPAAAAAPHPPRPSPAHGHRRAYVTLLTK